MIYETDYFIEIEKSMITPTSKPGDIINIQESPKETKVFTLLEQKDILVK